MNILENITRKERNLLCFDSNKRHKVVCFGASLGFNRILDVLNDMQITPDFLCDNDKNKHNTYINNFKTYAPEEVFTQPFSFIVIISSTYAFEIKEQLTKYKNIILCDDYRYLLPSKVYKTNMSKNADEVKVDKLFDFDINISILDKRDKNDKFRGLEYLNYLSYCNQIIAEDGDENILYLCESKYNFNELNVKTMLEYFIFRWYEAQSDNPIIIDSLHELNMGNLLTVIQETISNLSKEKFEFVKSTQSLKKRKSHALIWHLYHVDMFEEINDEMQNSAELFDIYISVNHECSKDDIKKILSVYPFANIFMFENRGRDVLPFLKIFKEIENLEYNSLCKIHTKKSTHRKDGADWGKVLRQRLFDGKNEILKSFKHDSKIGAYVAKEHLADSSYVGLNRDNVQMTCDMLNITYTDDFYFPFGTIFWCRPEAISQLSSNKLKSKYFVIENGELDGTFAHAIERLIGLLVKENGYFIAEI